MTPAHVEAVPTRRISPHKADPKGLITRARVSKVLTLLIVSALTLPLALAQAPATPASIDKSAPVPQDKVAPAKAVTTEPSTYAGAEACKTCHADIYTGWEKSPHWKQTYKEGGIAKHGCEDCHGPASSHIADPTDTSKLFLFEKASTKDINDRCLTCHAGGTQHMNAINSEHSKNGVSCVSCHSPHHAKEPEFLLDKGAARALLHMPSPTKSPVRYAFPPSSKRRARPMQRLPQRAWHGRAQASTDFVHAGCGLLQMPHRQAGAICLRACADQG